MITRKELNEEYQRIPPFVPTLLRLTDVVLSGSYTIDEVVRVIRFDQGLTADVIRYSNSAESSSSRSIASLQEAVVRMGGGRILRYLLAHWFHGSIAGSIGTDSSSHELWKHGIYSAVASEIIERKYKTLKHPAAFTTALLHDIGMVPLILHAKKHAIEFGWDPNEDSSELERQLFGYTHAEVGAMLLDTWQFPKDIVDTVRFHSLYEGGPAPLVDIVRLANRCASAAVLEGNKRDPHLEFLAHLEADPNDLNALVDRVRQESERVIADFSE